MNDILEGEVLFDAAQEASRGKKIIEVRTDRRFWYGPGGALVTDEAIEGVTQEQRDAKSVAYYGARYFVCETLTYEAARKLAELLGGELEEK